MRGASKPPDEKSGKLQALRGPFGNSGNVSKTNIRFEENPGKVVEEEINSVLSSYDLVAQFRNITPLPREISNREFEVVNFVGEGAFGFVETVTEAKRKAGILSAPLTIYNEDGNKGNAIYARKIFDLRKKLEPRNPSKFLSKHGNVRSREKYFKQELSSEFDKIQHEISLFHRVTESGNSFIVAYYGYQTFNRGNSRQVALYMESCVTSLLTLIEGKVDKQTGSVSIPGYKFGVNELRVVANCVLLALQHIHRCGVVHLDIKPDNMLVDRYGTVKLCDFGVSSLTQTPPELIQFTPAYVSPELFIFYDREETGLNRDSLEERDKLDEEIIIFFNDKHSEKCDVWSLGFSLFHLLLRTNPHEILTMNQLRRTLCCLITLSKTNQFPSYLDLLLFEAKSKQQQQQQQNKYENELSVFLNEYQDKDSSSIYLLLEFIKQCLVVDYTKRLNINSLLKHEFLDVEINILQAKERTVRRAGVCEMKKIVEDYLLKDKVIQQKENKKSKRITRISNLLLYNKLIGKAKTESEIVNFKGEGQKRQEDEEDSDRDRGRGSYSVGFTMGLNKTGNKLPDLSEEEARKKKELLCNKRNRRKGIIAAEKQVGVTL